MRRLGLGLGFWTLLLLLSLFPRAVSAQSQNEQANQWFRSGLNQKNVAQAIADYRKALEFDPDFKEALYNLALLYRKQKDHAQARTLLERARATPSGQSDPGDLVFNITYELAMICAQLDDTEASELALRDAKTIAPDAKREARISLEIARLLHHQGRHHAALQELAEGRRLDADARASFDKLQSSIEEILRIDQLYQEAAKERARGNLENALTLYRQIQARQPGFKNVPMEIADLSEQIELDSQDENAEQLYLQAQGYEADDRLELAIAAYEKLLLMTTDYEDVEFRLQRVRQRLEKKQRLLNVQPWLAALQADSGRAVVAARARRYYVDGRRAMTGGNYARALVAFEKALELNPGDAEVEHLLSEVRRHLQPVGTLLPYELRTDAWQPAENLQAHFQADPTTEAVTDSSLARAAALDSSVMIVPAISQLRDNDAKFFDQADFVAGEEAVVDAGWDWRTIILATTAVALILLCFSNVFPFSGVVQAHAFLLVGNLDRAALIYEKQLQRDPQNVRIYPRLAGIYLRAGRTDAAALHIYESTLRLNPAEADREKIFALMAQSKHAPNVTTPAAEPLPKQRPPSQYRTTAR